MTQNVILTASHGLKMDGFCGAGDTLVTGDPVLRATGAELSELLVHSRLPAMALARHGLEGSCRLYTLLLPGGSRDILGSLPRQKKGAGPSSLLLLKSGSLLNLDQRLKIHR